MFEFFLKKNSQPLDQLPEVVLENILSHLPKKEVLTTGQCSKKLNYFSLNEWKKKNALPKHLDKDDITFCEIHKFKPEHYSIIYNEESAQHLRTIHRFFDDYETNKPEILKSLLTNHFILLARLGVKECLEWMASFEIKGDAPFDCNLIDEQQQFYDRHNLEILSLTLSSLNKEKVWEKKPTALHFAVEQGKTSCVNLLLTQEKNKTDANAKDAGNATPLHYAILNPNLEIVNQLIRAGAEVNAKTTSELKTPLFILSWKPCANSFAIVERLLAEGADINAQDRAGCTPLHVLLRDASTYSERFKNSAECEEKYKTALKLSLFLIRQGANIEIKDKNGKTPLDYCDKKAWVYKMQYQASEYFYQTKQSIRKHCVIL